MIGGSNTMKKTILTIALSILLLAFTVTAIGQVDITSITTAPANPGALASFTVNVQNTQAGTTIPAVTFQSTELTGPGGRVIAAPTMIRSVTTLAAGTPQSITFGFTVPAGTPAGAYTGTLRGEEQGNTANFDSQAYTLTVTSAAGIIFNPASISFFGEPGDEAETTVTIQNIGNIALTNLVLSHTLGTLEDDDENKIELTFNPSRIASLASGATQTVTIKADIESGFQQKSFEGLFRVAADQLSTPAETRLNLGVKPIACVAGNKGRLDVEINEPEDNDEFRAGDQIPVQVTVENNGPDARIVAVLYNEDEDRIVDRHTTESKSIDRDEDAVYEFTLELDSGAQEDDDYTIYVKAYERGDEDVNCNDRENIDIQVQELKDFVQVESFSLSPTSATCGEDVSGSLRLVNRGSNRATATVTIRNQELALTETSPSFTLDRFGRGTYERVLSFALKIPKNADEKAYKIIALVNFNGVSNSAEQTLNVVDCKQETTVAQPPTQQPEQPRQDTQTPTGDVIFTQKGFLDQLSRGVPASFWILADAVLVLLIIFLIVRIARRGKNY